MTEKELLSQLNKLQNIKPDNQWKNDNRDVLLNQISGGEEIMKIGWFKVLENMLPQQLIRQLSQPAWAVVLIMAIVFGSGIVSLNASRDTKPGDSLYIAKIISEKAQLAITFNEKEKAKLGIEFAGNRAKEITQVLAESESIIKEKEAKVEKLTKDFKKEINTVKNRLEKISISSVDNQACEKESDEEMHVFSANLEKGDQRMEISEPDSAELTGEQQSDDSVQSQTETTVADATSEDLASSNAGQTNNITKVLEEAEKLFDEKDYSGTLNKLTEANNIIDNADDALPSSAQESDTASTTDCGADGIDDVEVLGVSEEANASEAIDDEDEAETMSSTK